MRGLTKKQKNLLIKWFKQAEPTKEAKLLFDRVNPLRDVEDLSTEQYEELKKINDTEVLYQNVNAFLWDLRFED